MTRTRLTYHRLLDLLGGDHELIVRLIEEGEIERRDEIMAVVDLDRVLIARTLVRELAAARRQIAELERALGAKADGGA